MAGEVSVLSGEIGQQIASQLFKVCGWEIGEHIQYSCNIERHKNVKGTSKKSHDLDGIYQYVSDFNHENNNTICISVKHNIEGYSSNRKGVLNQAIKDLSQCLECSKVSSELNRLSIESRGRKTSYIGVLIMISSDQDNISYNLIEEQFQNIKIPRLEKFGQIYIIDNNRASFIYSAIQHSKLVYGNAKLKFLYHHTGLNQDPDQLAYSGSVMQVEQLGSSILPIVMESLTKTSLFFFVNEEFEIDSLKRILWLAIKLGGGFVEIRIYFKRFENTKRSLEVVSVKNEFKDQDTLSRVTIHNLNTLDFAALIESGEETVTTNMSVDRTTTKSANVDNRAEADSTIDKILPFGSMVKPLLSSSQLSYTDLRNFLLRRGIVCKASDKQSTIPIFASLLWKPSDIDELRLLLIEKEDKPKNITYTTKWNKTSISLREAFYEIQEYVPELPLSSNCKVLNEPKFIPLSATLIELELEIERVNKTKDLLTGTTHHSGKIVVELVDDTLRIDVEHTAIETKKFLNKTVELINSHLMKKGCIDRVAKPIKFNAFKNNKERIDFLMDHQKIDYSGTFKNGTLINIKIKPDALHTDIPSDLKHMINKVSNLDIVGEQLEELQYVNDDKYKPAILLERIKIEYSFTYEEDKGTCIAEIGFPSTLNSRSVDYETKLQCSVEIPNRRENHGFKKSKKVLMNILSREISDIANEKYKVLQK